MTDTEHIPESDFGDWRVRYVVDTRQEALETDGRYHAVPGTGEGHLCAVCGRVHEVWAVLVKYAKDAAGRCIPVEGGGEWATKGFVIAATAKVGVQCAKRMGHTTMRGGVAISNRANWRRQARAA